MNDDEQFDAQFDGHDHDDAFGEALRRQDRRVFRAWRKLGASERANLKADAYQWFGELAATGLSSEEAGEETKRRLAERSGAGMGLLATILISLLVEWIKWKFFRQRSGTATDGPTAARRDDALPDGWPASFGDIADAALEEGLEGA